MTSLLYRVNEIPANHPALPALFDPALPDNPVLWAVLKGNHAGRTLVDDPHHPTQCVLRTDTELTFISRRISQAFLDEALVHLRQIGPVALVWSRAIAAGLRPPAAVRIDERLEFYENNPDDPLYARLRQCLPLSFHMQPIHRDMLERCEWREDMEFFCGSLDNFLRHGLGLCMLHVDEIIVEAYVSSFGQRYAEIGAVTRPAYRRRGYASIACAFIIKACQARGCQAYWSCDLDNPASIYLARKLGFCQEKAYQVLELV